MRRWVYLWQLGRAQRRCWADAHHEKVMREVLAYVRVAAAGVRGLAAELEGKGVRA